MDANISIVGNSVTITLSFDSSEYLSSIGSINGSVQLPIESYEVRARTATFNDYTLTLKPLRCTFNVSAEERQRAWQPPIFGIERREAHLARYWRLPIESDKSVANIERLEPRSLQQIAMDAARMVEQEALRAVWLANSAGTRY